MSRRQPAVNFRLEPGYYRDLVRLAGDESANLKARDLVTRGLYEEALEARIDGRLAETANQLRALRRELRLMAQTLLHLTGKASPEEAKRWADKYLPDET